MTNRVKTNNTEGRILQNAVREIREKYEWSSLLQSASHKANPREDTKNE